MKKILTDNPGINNAGVALSLNTGTFPEKFKKNFGKSLSAEFWEAVSNEDVSVSELFAKAVSSERTDRNKIIKKTFEWLKSAGVIEETANEMTKFDQAFKGFFAFKKARKKLKKSGFDTSGIESWYLNQNQSILGGAITTLISIILITGYWHDTPEFYFITLLLLGPFIVYFLYLFLEWFLKNTIGEIHSHRGRGDTLNSFCELLVSSPANFLIISENCYDDQVFNYFFSLFDIQYFPQQLKNCPVKKYDPPKIEYLDFPMAI